MNIKIRASLSILFHANNYFSVGPGWHTCTIIVNCSDKIYLIWFGFGCLIEEIQRIASVRFTPLFSSLRLKELFA